METKYGRQTPTKSFVLEYDRTLAKKAVEYYEQSKNILYEWQKKLLDDIMAVDSSGIWIHSKVGYSVPRRNGKTEAVYAREIYGLFAGEQICHTAHRTSTSHSSFLKTCGLLDRMGIEYESIRAKGAEEIRFPASFGKISYRTRTGSGGLGEGFDLLIIDEAQEYTDDQRTALVYTVTDSKNPQTIMCGTPPTNVSKGTVFPKFRKSCLAGTEKNALWAEWSVDQMSDIHDTSLWYETNPSMGYHLNERKIEDEISSDEVDFNIQRLGLWLEYSQSSAISKPRWDALKADTVPDLTGKLSVGVKFGKDGKNAAMSIAVKTKDGKVFIEALDCRDIHKGNLWMIDFMKAADIESVVIDGQNGQTLLRDDMKEFGIKKKPILPKVQEVVEANALFETAVFGSHLVHSGQISLSNVVTNCEKRAIGTNGGFGYKSQKEDMDIVLMESAILAHWACIKAKPKKTQKIYC